MAWSLKEAHRSQIVLNMVCSRERTALYMQMFNEPENKGVHLQQNHRNIGLSLHFSHLNDEDKFLFLMTNTDAEFIKRLA